LVSCGVINIPKYLNKHKKFIFMPFQQDYILPAHRINPTARSMKQYDCQTTFSKCLWLSLSHDQLVWRPTAKAAYLQVSLFS
jgi:hypothetical protein